MLSRMVETVQPGAEMEESTYKRLKDLTEELDGSLRGNLGRRLTEAVEMYCEQLEGGDLPPDRGDRIESDISTINRNIAELRQRVEEIDEGNDSPEADGGAYTLLSDQNTDGHRDDDGSSTDDEIPDSKPHGRDTRRAKAKWLASQLKDKPVIHAEYDLGELIDDEYGFDEDTRETLIQLTMNRLPHVQHPGENATGDLYASPEKAEEIRDKAREEAQDEHDSKSEKLEDAEPADADGGEVL